MRRHGGLNIREVLMAGSKEADDGRPERLGLDVARRPKSSVLPAAKVRRLLENAQYSVDHDLSQRCLMQVLALSDGRALILFESGKGRLYESRRELEAMLAEVELRMPQAFSSAACIPPQNKASTIEQRVPMFRENTAHEALGQIKLAL
jgi:hypothetical protein